MSLPSSPPAIKASLVPRSISNVPPHALCAAGKTKSEKKKKKEKKKEGMVCLIVRDDRHGSRKGLSWRSSSFQAF